MSIENGKENIKTATYVCRESFKDSKTVLFLFLHKNWDSSFLFSSEEVDFSGEAILCFFLIKCSISKRNALGTFHLFPT